MELYSFAFLIFIVFFLIAHEVTGKFKSEYQWIVRLLASVSFYAYIAKWRTIALLISVVTVWFAAKTIDKIATTAKKERKEGTLTKEEKKAHKQQELGKKRLVLYLTLGINIGILVLAKYILPAKMSGFVLPLGISFYTFMGISYLVDVYGEKYHAEGNLARVALYLSWFPQMIQGPINRYDYVKEGLFGKSRVTYDGLRYGFLWFAFGAIKKYALANVLAPCVNEIFLRDNISDLPGSYLLFIAFLFAIEQYADFSGGIDMVMAVSSLFGVKMNENFRQPYFSKSISEFWRRWHISLGAFLRDYVFYPFALLPSMTKLNKKVSDRFGKRFGRSLIAGIGNLLIFLLVGLWHGRELHYIFWGLYNGLIIVISDFCDPLFNKIKATLHIKDGNKGFSLFQMARTFFIIVLAGYFDAVEDVKNGFICFKNTFTSFRAGELGPYIKYLYDCKLITDIGIIVAVVAFAVLIFFSVMRENGKDFFAIILKKNIVLRWAVYFAMIYLLLFGFAVAGGNGGFMYGAF